MDVLGIHIGFSEIIATISLLVSLAAIRLNYLSRREQKLNEEARKKE